MYSVIINKISDKAADLSTIVLAVSLLSSLIWAANQPNPWDIKNLNTGIPIDVDSFKSERNTAHKCNRSDT